MKIKHDIADFSIDFSALQGLKTLKYMNKKKSDSRAEAVKIDIE